MLLSESEGIPSGPAWNSRARVWSGFTRKSPLMVPIQIVPSAVSAMALVRNRLSPCRSVISQTVPAAWNRNSGGTSWAPTKDTPHLFFIGNAQQRFYKDVLFPSQKVHMFEEFDRLTNSAGIWFAYDNAKCNLLFFDSSVRNLPTNEANAGANPDEPDTLWKQRYFPLDTFPSYAPGFKNREEFLMRYRWTREGLHGVDYGGTEINYHN